MKRKETVKTGRKWPQAKRKPSATFRKTTAAFRWPKYLRLSYCPNCALLSNHFLAHSPSFHTPSFSSSKFTFFASSFWQWPIAAPAVRARSSIAYRCSNCVLLLCGNSVSTSSDCILSNFSCCLQMTAKKAAMKCTTIAAVLYDCPNHRFTRPSAVPEPSTHRMRNVDNVITVVLPRNPCRKREYSQSHHEYP